MDSNKPELDNIMGALAAASYHVPAFRDATSCRIDRLEEFVYAITAGYPSGTLETVVVQFDIEEFKWKKR